MLSNSQHMCCLEQERFMFEVGGTVWTARLDLVLLEGVSLSAGLEVLKDHCP